MPAAPTETETTAEPKPKPAKQAPTTTTGRLCPLCGTTAPTFRPGPSGRPDAACPKCGSLERHRFLALLLDGLVPWLSAGHITVDVAPSRQIEKKIKLFSRGSYVSLDFDPAADGRPVDLRTSLTTMPFADDSVGLLFAYHVLEHIPDDAAAMREIARVLAPDGIALVQVPWRRGRETDEDPSAGPEERLRRFGQADHVRYYGRDFEDRLRAAGLDVARLTPGGVLGEPACRLLRLEPREAVWALTAATGTSRPAPDLDAASMRRVLTHLLTTHDADSGDRAALQRQLDALRAELVTTQEKARHWEDSYRRLRGRTPVRLLAAVSQPIRRRGR